VKKFARTALLIRTRGTGESDDRAASALLSSGLCSRSRLQEVELDTSGLPSSLTATSGGLMRKQASYGENLKKGGRVSDPRNGIAAPANKIHGSERGNAELNGRFRSPVGARSPNCRMTSDEQEPEIVGPNRASMEITTKKPRNFVRFST